MSSLVDYCNSVLAGATKSSSLTSCSVFWVLQWVLSAIRGSSTGACHIYCIPTCTVLTSRSESIKSTNSDWKWRCTGVCNTWVHSWVSDGLLHSRLWRCRSLHLKADTHYPCSRPVNTDREEHERHIWHPCSRPVNTEHGCHWKRVVDTGSVYRP